MDVNNVENSFEKEFIRRKMIMSQLFVFIVNNNLDEDDTISLLEEMKAKNFPSHQQSL